ncbi:MAG: hypothetical protein EXR75_13300 [Myxococcales bacterium]|nr:hypothetical protein [Myxococcales bacterium]
MLDVAVLGVLLSSFAAFVTVHIAILVRLGTREPRYRALVALLLPPLAPYWARVNGWHRTQWLWLGAVVVYLIARIAAEP